MGLWHKTWHIWCRLALLAFGTLLPPVVSQVMSVMVYDTCLNIGGSEDEQC